MHPEREQLRLADSLVEPHTPERRTIKTSRFTHCADHPKEGQTGK